MHDEMKFTYKLSVMWCFVKNTSRKYCTRLISEIHFAIKLGDKILSSVICHDSTQIVVRCAWRAHCKEEVSCDGIPMEHTRKTLRHALNPRYLQQSSWYCCTGINTTSSWSTLSRRYCVSIIGAASLWNGVTPTAHMNAKSPKNSTDTIQWRSHNFS
jgi:hypothetical protein